MISLIFFMGFLGVIECHLGHARPGNYTHLITDYSLCGKSRDWFKKPNHCFKDHPFFSEPIEEGRQALRGEAPWTVHIEIVENTKYTCTGSLIAMQWVLTAAHCLVPNTPNVNITEINVRLGVEYMKGKPYTVIQRVMHPSFPTDKVFDAALIKLNEQVPIEKYGEYYQTNVICLPPKDLQMQLPNAMSNLELVMVSGWGKGHDNHLKIASLRLRPGLHPRGLGNTRAAIKMRNIGHGNPCSGDSGSPVWQYFEGRAIQIGVFQLVYDVPGYCNTSTYELALYVPLIVDWIIQTIT